MRLIHWLVCLALIVAAFGAVCLVFCQPVASGTVRRITLQSELLPLKRADPGQSRVGRLNFLGAVSLKSGDREFGGISGIIWEKQCRRLLGISDTGMWVVLEPAENDDRLTGVKDGWLAPILDMKGNEPTSKIAADAEELAQTADGDVWVFYEQKHRVERFTGLSGCDPESLASKPVEQREFAETKDWHPNAGMEAATAIGQSLLAISERAPAPDHGRQGFLATPDGKVSSFAWTAPEGFDPTAMDFFVGADRTVHLLVLHRRFSPLGGLAATIHEARLGPSTALGVPERLEGTRIATLAPPYSIDNMEGLAVRVEQGRVFVYLISDDNFKFFQRTILMKFELLPPPKTGGK